MDARLPVSASSYRQFKSRWKLRTKRQWTICFGSAAWAMATACASEHARAVRVFRDSCGIIPPVGVAVDFALSRSSSRSRAPRLGLLPVEVALHARSLYSLLDHLGLELSDWLTLDARDRDELWAAGGSQGIAELLYLPAVVQLTAELEWRAA